MKSVILFISIIFSYFIVQAQEQDNDFALIEQASVKKSGHEADMSGLFKIYQRHVSEQLISDCIYEESCSHFSQGAIKAYGPIKGFIMTLDRLTRCSRAARAETPSVRINENGKIIDHWDDYKKTK